eukprot:Gb_15780 [translate_table: standard]
MNNCDKFFAFAISELRPPRKLLKLRSIIVAFGKPQIPLGTFPCRLLLLILKRTKLLQSPYDWGNSPVKPFSRIRKYCRFPPLQISFGSGPLKRFSETSIMLNLDKLPSFCGNWPVKLFSYRDKPSRNGNSPKLSGI